MTNGNGVAHDKEEEDKENGVLDEIDNQESFGDENGVSEKKRMLRPRKVANYMKLNNDSGESKDEDMDEDDDDNLD